MNVMARHWDVVRGAIKDTRGNVRISAAMLADTLLLLDEQIAANEQVVTKVYVSKRLT